MTRFVVVPQWQGSPAARAMLLADGAEAIAGDLPRAACVRVDVPAEAGETLGTGIRRYSSLARIRTLVDEALDRALDGAGDHAVVVGGDCGVAVPAIAHAAARHPRLAVVWFDAHGDLHDEESSPSGAFAGMALRAATGATPLAAAAAVPPQRVVLAGARSFDGDDGDGELQTARALGIRSLSPGALADPAALVAALDETDATAVYVHVDLDVLDPAAISGVADTVPFGLDVPALTAAIAAVRGRMPLAGASIAGFAPATPDAAVDDLGAILRIVGALA
ncbi:arginase family protein [Microbacterium sp. No. 7]|uniref:arginase family protein n=1 Tax=Microbacterium sp. No. 7 TaxID=1714373 RepID=UPI0006D0E3F2|nr:arginase family protein [Microbacterium sp. No. 7]ALJ21227.1 arginase [Microbacterium sp. No. 7]